MGAPTPQIQNPQTSSSGKGSSITYPGQSGQPAVGQPNNYTNTIGPWDNSTNSTQNPLQGKGKGA